MSKDVTNLEYIHKILHSLDVPSHLLKRQSLQLADCDLEIQDESGFTALMIEVLRGELSTIELLLTHGAKTGIENDSGETALILAIEGGVTSIVELVVTYADANYENKHGDRPVDIARYYGDSDIVKILKRYGGEGTGKKTHLEEMDELGSGGYLY